MKGVYNTPSSVCIVNQVESAIEAVDAVKSTFGPTTKIILVAHSFGSYISLQVCACYVFAFIMEILSRS